MTKVKQSRDYPLIMESSIDEILNVTPASTFPVSQNGVITTGRGELLAVQPFYASTFDWEVNSLAMSVDVNGISILDKVDPSRFNFLVNQQDEKASKMLPLSAGSGSNYDFTISDIENRSFAGFMINGVLIRHYEGFSIAQYEKTGLSTKRKAYSLGFAGNEVPPAVTPPTINATLPKDKGRILGFKIGVQVNTATVFTIPGVINLNIAGVEVIKEIPLNYFLPQAFTQKEFMFDEPLEGGQTFSLELFLLAVTFQGAMYVEWIFE